jgi:hypothetical protein
MSHCALYWVAVRTVDGNARKQARLARADSTPLASAAVRGRRTWRNPALRLVIYRPSCWCIGRVALCGIQVASGVHRWRHRLAEQRLPDPNALRTNTNTASTTWTQTKKSFFVCSKWRCGAFPSCFFSKRFAFRMVDLTASLLTADRRLLDGLPVPLGPRAWAPQLHQLPWLTSPWLRPVARLQKTVWSKNRQPLLPEPGGPTPQALKDFLHHKDNYIPPWELAVRAGRHQRSAVLPRCA